MLRSSTTVECTSAVEIDLPAALTTRAMAPTGTVALEIIWFAGHVTVRWRRVSSGSAVWQVSPMTAGRRIGAQDPSETVTVITWPLLASVLKAGDWETIVPLLERGRRVLDGDDEAVGLHGRCADSRSARYW